MIVVTGGGGFLGRHVVDGVRERMPGRAITVLDPKPPGGLGGGATQILEGSVLDGDLVSTAVGAADAVVHLAAVVEPDSDDEERLRRVNVEGTRTVYRAAVDAGCSVFVHLSSSGVYGPPVGPESFGEEDPADPRTPYQRSKWEAERALQALPSNGTVLNILRPAGVYGPGSRLEVPRYRKVRRRKWSLELEGGVEVQPTYVADVAGAVLSLLERPASDGRVFNVGGPRTLLVQELEAVIASEMGVSRRRIRVPSYLAAPAACLLRPLLALVGRDRPDLARMCRGEVLSAAVDDRRLRRAYPQVPSTGLRRGLQRHLRWAREEGLLETRGSSRPVAV